MVVVGLKYFNCFGVGIVLYLFVGGVCFDMDVLLVVWVFVCVFSGVDMVVGDYGWDGYFDVDWWVSDWMMVEWVMGLNGCWVVIVI